MSEQIQDGGDRVLVLALNVKRLANLRRVPQAVRESLPDGYTIASIEVKAFLERTQERGRP